MKYIFSGFLLFSIGTNLVFAQSIFDVQVSIFGSDTTPPSTSTLLSATPVASTQIDLSWSSSTDDYAVAGYSILRGGTAIATTTLLTYSDTGLTASTTYSYAVRAFDLVTNYSTTSNSIATTTLEATVVPPAATTTDSNSTQGTASRVVLDELHITESVSTTSLDLTTARPARIEVRWGRTASYELGYVMSDAYVSDHSVLLTDLEPGTKYEFEIIGYTPRGTQSVLRSGSFVTLSQIQSVVPANVGRFQAVQSNNDVELNWLLPVNTPVSQVRIVRSHLGFPEYPQNGAVVYQGVGAKVTDVGVLEQYSPAYYTAFVYDVYGNVSSGAVAIVYATSPSAGGSDEETKNPTTGSVIVPDTTNEATTSVNIERVTPEMKMPNLSEIIVTQSDRPFSFSDKNIALDKKQDFRVSVSAKEVAGNLKSIIVTLLDLIDNQRSYSFLLRINKNQTAYEATISAFNVEGRSQLKLEIYDYEAFVVATYQTPITFIEPPEDVNLKRAVFPDVIFEYVPVVFGATTITIIVAMIIWYVIRLRHKG